MLPNTTELTRGKGGIYIITFYGTGYYYGGRTHDFDNRWRYHLWSLRAGRHGNVWVQHVFDKYGESTFQPVVFAFLEDEDERVRREQEWLNQHFGKPNCLNLSASAATQPSFKGHKHSDETRKHLSATLKGREFSLEHREALAESATGREFPAEIGIKLAERNRARVWTEENRRRASEAQIGRTHSAETKAKMSETRKRIEAQKRVERQSREPTPEELAVKEAKRLRDVAKARAYRERKAAAALGKR